MDNYKVPCGRTTGHGYSCEKNGLCSGCAEVVRLTDQITSLQTIITLQAKELADARKQLAAMAEGAAIEARVQRALVDAGVAVLKTNEEFRKAYPEVTDEAPCLALVRDAIDKAGMMTDHARFNANLDKQIAIVDAMRKVRHERRQQEMKVENERRQGFDRRARSDPLKD